MANFDLAVAKTLVREGGNKITNDSFDRGGLTRFGISQRAFPDKDIANLSERDAIEIYRNYYWDKVSGDEILHQEYAESIFDAAVNMGVKTAVVLAQKALGMNGSNADGLVGARTLIRLNGDESFLHYFAIEKIKHYTQICRKDAGQKRFYFGWVSRSLEGL